MESRVLGTEPGILHFQSCPDRVLFSTDLDWSDGVPLTACRAKSQTQFRSWNCSDVNPISSGIHREEANSRTFHRFVPARLHIAESHLLCCHRPFKRSQTAGRLTIADPNRRCPELIASFIDSHLLTASLRSCRQTNTPRRAKAVLAGARSEHCSLALCPLESRHLLNRLGIPCPFHRDF